MLRPNNSASIPYADALYYSLRKPYTDGNWTMDRKLAVVQTSPVVVRIASFRLMDDVGIVVHAEEIVSLAPSTMKAAVSLNWLEVFAAKCIDHQKCILFRVLYGTDSGLIWCIFFKAA